MKSFPEKVRYARKGLHLSQAQLGEMCGLSARAIQTYEQGIKRPRQAALLALSKALNVTLDYLTDDECQDPNEGMTAEAFIEKHYVHSIPRNQGSETLSRVPASAEDFVGIPSEEALESERHLVSDREVEELRQANSALFAGGDLTQDQKDEFFNSLMTSYILCKQAYLVRKNGK